jgi:hypothetical protein
LSLFAYARIGDWEKATGSNFGRIRTVLFAHRCDEWEIMLFVKLFSLTNSELLKTLSCLVPHRGLVKGGKHTKRVNE